MKFFCFLFNSGIYGLPKRNGKLKDISKFDATFFGVHAKQAHTMDPQLRLLLEVSYEAILDGGKQKSLEFFIQKSYCLWNECTDYSLDKKLIRFRFIHA